MPFYDGSLFEMNSTPYVPKKPLAVDDPFMTQAYDCDDQTSQIPMAKNEAYSEQILKTFYDAKPSEEELKYLCDSISDFVSNLQKPTKKAKQAMADLGITTNDRGGKQSRIESNFHLMHLIPEYCYQVVFSILEAGAVKYGLDNWMKISTEDHINHAIRHLRLFLAGDTSENHLGNASCRCLFALYTANHNEN